MYMCIEMSIVYKNCIQEMSIVYKYQYINTQTSLCKTDIVCMCTQKYKFTILSSYSFNCFNYCTLAMLGHCFERFSQTKPVFKSVTYSVSSFVKPLSYRNVNKPIQSDH